MYRVSYNKLLQILERGECRAAITELQAKRAKGELDSINVIEVNFTIDDKNTEHEILTVTEFNIYCANVVLFGVPLKHDSDFTIEWARTKPRESYVVMTGDVEVAMPNVDANTKEKLDFLAERALDACEYADTDEERKESYKECDEAKAVVAQTLRDITNRLKLARGKLGDLSRVIEKQCGNSDGEDEIDRRIDEIHEILNQKGA